MTREADAGPLYSIGHIQTSAGSQGDTPVSYQFNDGDTDLSAFVGVGQMGAYIDSYVGLDTVELVYEFDVRFDSVVGGTVDAEMSLLLSGTVTSEREFGSGGIEPGGAGPGLFIDAVGRNGFSGTYLETSGGDVNIIQDGLLASFVDDGTPRSVVTGVYSNLPTNEDVLFRITMTVTNRAGSPGSPPFGGPFHSTVDFGNRLSLNTNGDVFNIVNGPVDLSVNSADANIVDNQLMIPCANAAGANLGENIFRASQHLHDAATLAASDIQHLNEGLTVISDALVDRVGGPALSPIDDAPLVQALTYAANQMAFLDLQAAHDEMQRIFNSLSNASKDAHDQAIEAARRMGDAGIPATEPDPFDLMFPDSILAAAESLATCDFDAAGQNLIDTGDLAVDDALQITSVFSQILEELNGFPSPAEFSTGELASGDALQITNMLTLAGEELDAFPTSFEFSFVSELVAAGEDIRAIAVPEPTTCALALVGLCFTFRQRRKSTVVTSAASSTRFCDSVLCSQVRAVP